MPTLNITVDPECGRCSSKIQKVLRCVQERGEFVIEKVMYEKDKVIVSGPFDAEKLACKLCCKAGRIIKNIEIVKPPPAETDKKEPKRRRSQSYASSYLTRTCGHAAARRRTANAQPRFCHPLLPNPSPSQIQLRANSYRALAHSHACRPRGRAAAPHRTASATSSCQRPNQYLRRRSLSHQKHRLVSARRGRATATGTRRRRACRTRWSSVMRARRTVPAPSCNCEPLPPPTKA
ncbi:hypothetical protein EJB05_38217 [Eragrostis curvula]|uniref:HMA domain-containing protein n=1 Tax=Eragrostis curvula TaxID=38414 RepID=A0A5J9TU48_9POAL|nr:hypothetical protein EJB05_38217 [Eragrostis curvula]